MGIADEDIARVREATDLVAVISEHLQLKRVGQRWVGLCPFHNENSPSFSVNQQLGFYHCFGCQRSGDAITFVRELEGLDFVAAVERLAAKTGVTLNYTSANEGHHKRRRVRLVEAVLAAVEFYHKRLLEASDAGPARAYLRDRGISGDDVRAYKIGWAPDKWDVFAQQSKISHKVLEDAGLGFVNKAGRIQDSFRARIMFPIFDLNNDPVGFGGRKLPHGDGPKYKNSGESLIYAKSRLLYGLNWAKEHIVRADEVIVCEGYTDVIGYGQAGVHHAVATCGTALSEDHVKLLKRFAKGVVLSFDADAAGQAAADRFYEWEKRYEVDVRVVSLPTGVDPGELAQTDPEALLKGVKDPAPFLAFQVDRVLETGDLSTVEGRARAADAALTLVREHPNPLVRDQYLMQIGAVTGVNPEQLRAVADLQVPRLKMRRPITSAEDIVTVDTVELQVLRVVVHKPELVPEIVIEDLFFEPLHRSVFEVLISCPTLLDAVEALDGDAKIILQRLIVQEIDEIDELQGERLVGRLVDEAATRELKRLEDLAVSTDDASVGRRMAELQHALVRLRSENWDITLAGSLMRCLDSGDQA